MRAHAERDMEYLVALWTRVQEEEPTVPQLQLILDLLSSKGGANSEEVWNQEHLSRRDAGAIIHELLKLPDKINRVHL